MFGANPHVEPLGTLFGEGDFSVLGSSGRLKDYAIGEGGEIIVLNLWHGLAISGPAGKKRAARNYAVAHLGFPAVLGKRHGRDGKAKFQRQILARLLVVANFHRFCARRYTKSLRNNVVALRIDVPELISPVLIGEHRVHQVFVGARLFAMEPRILPPEDAFHCQTRSTKASRPRS